MCWKNRQNVNNSLTLANQMNYIKMTFPSCEIQNDISDTIVIYIERNLHNSTMYRYAHLPIYLQCENSIFVKRRQTYHLET